MVTQASSIFRDGLRPRGLGTPHRTSHPSTPGPSTPRLVTPTCDTAIDGRLIAILDAPLVAGESAHVGFQRKEHELGAAFAALSVLDARNLHVRLASCKPGDTLAHKFARMTLERRGRLLNFLADARRREALVANR
jgi:hypothetical protein